MASAKTTGSHWEAPLGTRRKGCEFKVNAMNGSEYAFGYLGSKCTRFNSTQKDSNTAQFSESFVHLSN